MHLEFAVAARANAESAFFADDSDEDADDGILRLALEDFSELELSRLSTLLVGGYQPSLVLDADVPEDIVTRMDPALVHYLAAPQSDAELARIAEAWAGLIGQDNPHAARPERVRIALETLQELCSAATAAGNWVLYTQFIEEPDEDF